MTAPDTALSAADSGFDNFDYSVAGDVRDPYPEFAAAREQDPVQFRQIFEGFPGSYFVYRHADVTRMLRDNVTFSSSILVQAMGAVMGNKIILGMDEPEHRLHRALVSPAFRQTTLARWEEALIADVVNGLIDKFIDRGHADLVQEFTFPFPTQVVAGVLGLPRADYRQFQKWAVAIITVNSNWDRGISGVRGAPRVTWPRCWRSGAASRATT